jgi:predicted Fe-Mo cluster-binding NifX family protein
VRYAAPLADAAGEISEHFGEAPYFGLIIVRMVDGQVEQEEILFNPYQEVDKAKGIRVGEWLVGLKTDVVLLREDVRGKGPAYVFGDANIEIRLTDAETLAAAISQQPEVSE